MFTKFKILQSFIIASVLFPIAGIAQAHCGTDEMYKIRLRNNPGLAQKEMEANNLSANVPVQVANKTGAVRVIPVVFHIIHEYGPENIPKQKVLTEIDSLNKCYRGWNGDTSLVRPQFKRLIADCNIQFVLAKLDPNGNCTDGIDRIASPQTYNADDNTKSLSLWDPTKYFNVWVVSAINSSSVPPGEYILGYSTFPWEAGDTTDGVIIRSDQIGTGTKTLVHEAGHYFGLYHPFQGGCGTSCSNANTGGDGICDTPPTSDENFNCDETDHACNNDTPMTENYMDYSGCSYLFTTDQVNVRINTYTPHYRSNLYSATNLAATGVDGSYNPVYCAPIADFYSSATITCNSKPVQFFNAPFNGPVSTYSWSFPGGTPNASIDSSPVITYASPGLYSVSLTVKNSQGFNIKTKNGFIDVNDSDKLVSPFSEGFETFSQASGNWQFPRNAGQNGNLGFQLTSSAANTGKYSLSLLNREGILDSSYSFTMPPVDISQDANYTIQFAYAFAKSASTNTDKFQVQVSQDCGVTFENIYLRPVAEFNTTSILVPLSTGFIPDSSEWKQANISFGNFSFTKELYFKFVITNGGGNDFYIDNINVGTAASGINNITTSINEVEVYPNPVTSQITIDLNSAQGTKLSMEVIDMEGRNLSEMTNIDIVQGRQSITFQARQLNIFHPGMYYLKLSDGNSVSVKKIIVE